MSAYYSREKEKKIGERLRELRAEKGLSQKEVASKIDGMSHVMVSNYETANPKYHINMDVLQEFAAVYEVSALWLAFETDVKNGESPYISASEASQLCDKTFVALLACLGFDIKFDIILLDKKRRYASQDSKTGCAYAYSNDSIKRVSLDNLLDFSIDSVHGQYNIDGLITDHVCILNVIINGQEIKYGQFVAFTSHVYDFIKDIFGDIPRTEHRFFRAHQLAETITEIDEKTKTLINSPIARAIKH